MSNQTSERTEHPTQKRKRDAAEKGNIARSRDLSSAISLAGVTLALGWFGLEMCRLVTERLHWGLSILGDQAHTTLEPGGLSGLVWHDTRLLARVAAPPALTAAIATIAATVAQTGWNYAPKALHLNWSRLSPAQGLRRLAPLQSLPELGKAVFGAAAIVAICYWSLHASFFQMPYLMSMSPLDSAIFGWELVRTVLWRASLALVVLAATDFGIQYYRWFSGLKMTKQEVKDEHRMQDGNPETKARVRRVQREMMRKRMLNAVKTATVVVTNPTHFAVALEYRRETMSAPIVVAKGQDEFAARIRAVAREHGVPLVENVTLARALYKTAEVGDAIPASLFGAVAEVIAYLVRLKQLVL